MIDSHDRSDHDFGRDDTAPAIDASNGRGPGNEHTPRAFHIVKPEARHDMHDGCHDGHAHERLAAHDRLFDELFGHVNGRDGRKGLSQNQAHYEAQLGYFADEAKEIKAALKSTDGKVDALGVNVSAVKQAVAERALTIPERLLIAIACLALAAMGVATAYRQALEAQRIEARP